MTKLGILLFSFQQGPAACENQAQQIVIGGRVDSDAVFVLWRRNAHAEIFTNWVPATQNKKRPVFVDVY